MESTDNKEIQVFGAIGPIPNDEKKILSYISIMMLVIGMIGLIVSAILKIKSKNS